MTVSSGRPGADEYAPFFATYVDLVTEGDIVRTLEADRVALGDFLGGIPEASGDHRYAEGKWSVRELIGHMIDAEWVFSQRAIWFARGTSAELPGMDQDEWVANASYSEVPLRDLCQQFDRLRQAGILQFQLFSATVLAQRGRASGCEFSVRALLYILAGHPRHHRGILRDRYL